MCQEESAHQRIQNAKIAAKIKTKLPKQNKRKTSSYVQDRMTPP